MNSPEQIKDGDFLKENGTKLDDLVNAIMKDGRVNGKDKDLVNQLVDEFDNEKRIEYIDTKEKTSIVMHNMIDTILTKGYDIFSQEDIDTLVNLTMKFEYNIPKIDYNSFLKKYGIFSIATSGDYEKPFAIYSSLGCREGFISAEGEFLKDVDLFSRDYLGNNNKINSKVHSDAAIYLDANKSSEEVLINANKTINFQIESMLSLKNDILAQTYGSKEELEASIKGYNEIVSTIGKDNVNGVEISKLTFDNVKLEKVSINDMEKEEKVAKFDNLDPEKSIVDYFKINNLDSSYKNRKKIALENGFSSYRGTAKQNRELYKILKSKINF